MFFYARIIDLMTFSELSLGYRMQSPYDNHSHSVFHRLRLEVLYLQFGDDHWIELKIGLFVDALTKLNVQNNV